MNNGAAAAAAYAAAAGAAAAAGVTHVGAWGRQGSDESARSSAPDTAAPPPAPDRLPLPLPLPLPPPGLWPPAPGAPPPPPQPPKAEATAAATAARVARAASLLRFREKKARRGFGLKRIRYAMRKANADKRPRVKGRFVKVSRGSSVGGRARRRARSCARGSSVPLLLVLFRRC